MRRFRSLSPAIVSACVAVVAVHAARARYGGTLRIQTHATASALEMRDVFETLVTVDPAEGLRPLLAVSWEADARAARWRFRLRHGVRLHDGAVLEPWHVAAALRSLSSAWTISHDGDVVIVDVAQPDPGLAWELADSRYAIVVAGAAGQRIGTGPFRIERLEPGRALLRAHDDYWGGRPFLDAVRIETGRPLAAQLADLDAGRADIVEVQPTDVRRLTERGVRVGVSRPRQLYTLVFEPHRATAAGEPMRRLFSAVLDRSTMCAVLLQRRAEPAGALLPTWLSGYDPGFVAIRNASAPRSAIAALPPEQRTVTLRVDPSDALSRPIAERIAVDAREAGFVVAVQAPSGLAPRPDVRLVRIALVPTSPDRALSRLMTDLGDRTVRLAMDGAPPPPGAPSDVVLRVERVLLERAVIVPVLRVSDLYGLGEGVDVWDGEVISPFGRLNVANIWIK